MLNPQAPRPVAPGSDEGQLFPGNAADFCRDHIPSSREEIPWSIMAAILVLGRFCAPSSELQMADSWYGKTALEDLIGVADNKINEDRLYRTLDALASPQG